MQSVAHQSTDPARVLRSLRRCLGEKGLLCWWKEPELLPSAQVSSLWRTHEAPHIVLRWRIQRALLSKADYRWLSKAKWVPHHRGQRPSDKCSQADRQFVPRKGATCHWVHKQERNQPRSQLVGDRWCSRDSACHVWRLLRAPQRNQ